MSALAGAGVLARPSTPQRRTPLVDALRAYAALGTHAFHVPGHKRGHGASADLLDLVGPAVLAADVWLESGAFDAARRAAEELAAAAWGAHRAYLLGNGSTAGNLAWMLATLREGDEVVLARDAHTSTLAGLVLSGARPVWVRPRRHPVLDVGLGVEPAAVAAALRGHPRARVVGLVSPSYAGSAATCRPSSRPPTPPGRSPWSTRRGGPTWRSTPACRCRRSRRGPTSW